MIVKIIETGYIKEIADYIEVDCCEGTITGTDCDYEVTQETYDWAINAMKTWNID